jgi:hypothetical protein
MPDPILAYIDPGSGSLIIQVLIASLIAIPVFFRNQIARVTGLSRRRRDHQTAVDDRRDPE